MARAAALHACCFLSSNVRSSKKERFNRWQRLRLRIRLQKIFIYDEIFTPACSPRGVLVRLMLRGADDTNDPAPQDGDIRLHGDARIPSAAATIQPERASPTNRYTPAAAAGSKLTSAGSCAAADKSRKGRLSVRIPVPGKPHLVESPYSPGKYIDVEGFPPGTEVKDPYTDKIFLVP